MSSPDFLSMLSDLGVDPEETQRRAARMRAGIPQGAAGPWDAALAISTQARAVAAAHRALTTRDAP